MRLINFLAVLFSIFILSGCNGAKPTLNKECENITAHVGFIIPNNKKIAPMLYTDLKYSSNKEKLFNNFLKKYGNGSGKGSSGSGWVELRKIPASLAITVCSMHIGDINLNKNGNRVIFINNKMTIPEYNKNKNNLIKNNLKRISSYEVNYLKEHRKLLNELPKLKETYVQPKNKKEPCKIMMGYREGDEYFKEDSWKVFWDGKCKNGFASGLGREIEKADMVDKWQIGIYKKGKAKDYLIQKDILNNAIIEGLKDENIWYSVNTFIKVKNGDINIRTQSGMRDNKNFISLYSYTSPFWNGTYNYTKEYMSFAYVYSNYEQNDINDKMDFEFLMKHNGGINNGWAIAKQKKSTSLITGEFIEGKFNPFELPQSYNQKSDEILSEIKKASQKAFQAQEQAQKVKKQYLKRICKKNVKVTWMDNDEYKEICNLKSEIALMKKINDKLHKISKEKISRLEKQRFNEQQEKEEAHRQDILNLERKRLSEIQRHNMTAERQEDKRRSQQGWKNLTEQINNMTPKTYNVNVMHY